MLYSFLEGMGLGSCQTKQSLDEPNAQELQQIDAPITSKIGHKNMKERNQKPDRDQPEVFSTSNYNGYETECWGSLSDQNFIDLKQIISKVVNICQMHGTGGREVVVFDRFQRYVEIVRIHFSI